MIKRRRHFFKKIGLGVFSLSFFSQFPFVSWAKGSSPSTRLDKVYFTNGFKICEVTQSSVIFWTRLCVQEVPNPVRHQREDKVFRHPIDFDENQPIATMDGAVQVGPGLVRARISSGDFEMESDWIAVSAKDDFTAKIPFTGLASGTTYLVTLTAKSAEKGPETVTNGSFSTATPSDQPVPVLLTTSTCQYFWSFDNEKRGFKTYDSMRALKPNFFIQTGDYVYYDKPGPLAKDIDTARHKWHAMDGWPSLRDLFREVPIYMLKDDHDLLKDDAHPASTPYGTLTYADGLKLWYENVPISGKPYRNIRRGKDLEIWMVEGREFRTPNDAPDGPNKTIWGKEQIDWFKASVAASDATFKILFTATPVVGPDRENKKDNHANKVYQTEGKWLRDFLAKIPNMFVVNGDRHWQYVSQDAETGLIEFGSGPVSDFHAQGWDPKDRRQEHRFLRVKGGFLSIQVDRGEGKPRIRFTHRDVAGVPTHEEVFS
nr:alkaline phosphatase [Cytophagales bacterium]